MRTLVLLLFVSLTVGATETAELKYRVGDDTGDMIIRIDDRGEPSYQPLLLRALVNCKQGREREKMKILIRGSKVCRYEGHSFDPTYKVLTIKYRTVDTKVEIEPPCTVPQTKTFPLNKICGLGH